MPRIHELKQGKKKYYYLEHSIRYVKEVKKKRIYLGENIPKNIEKLKEEFLLNLLLERWGKELEAIQKKHQTKTIPKSAREKEIQNFAIQFTYDTQKIEGSTLTLQETAQLIERKISPRKPLDDIKEAEAHEKVFYHMLNYEKDLTLTTILHWHKELLKETKNDIAGRIRKHQVKIAGSKFLPPPPIEVDILLREFITQYRKDKKKLHPVILAALVHLRFVTIHPFTDGNGRISRILMNFVLNKHGYPMVNIPYIRRNSYYNALERAQVNKEEHIFIQWFIKQYIREQT